MIHFINVPITLDAAAADTRTPRTIAGIAVPWDTVATVSSGEKVMFKRGAFDLNAKPARLLENHDGRPIGIVTELIDLENGLGFSATFATSKAASDVVELIQMNAYDSVSVGAVPQKFKYDKNGVMIVSSAMLQELSVVAVPAFSDAIIEQIAASEPKEDATEPTPTDSEEEPEVATQENPVVEVEASIIPTTPIYATAKREFKLPSPAEYISALVRGGADFEQMNANIRAAAPDVKTADTPGILPTPIVQPVYNNFRGLRPVIDAIGAKAMPGGGKVFIRPSVTTHTSIAVQSAESANLQSGTFVVASNQVTKGTYGGYVSISEQDMDWTDPSVVGLILDDMARIYANQTDDVAADALVAGASVTRVLSAVNLLLPAKVVEWVYGAATTILSSSNGNLPTHLFVSSDMFASIGQLADTTGRPLFPQVGPMNAFGQIAPGSTEAVAFGLRVVVDRNFAPGTMIAADASGFEIFEDQKGAISVDVPQNLTRTLAFRGYLATLMIDNTKFVARVAA